MKIFWITMLLLLGTPWHLLSQTAGDPVPPNWLREGRLYMPELNFSVASPNPNSHWRQLAIPNVQGSKVSAFIVNASPDEQFVLAVYDVNGKMDSNEIKGFIKGMNESQPKYWKAQDVEMQPSTIPTSDSVRAKFTVKLPTDLILYSYGYVVSGRRAYYFTTYTTATTEPENFKQFFSSFALITPSANALATANAPGSAANGILLIFSIIGAIVDARYKAKGGDKPTSRELRYLGIAALIFLGLLIIAVLYGVSAENLGAMIGQLSILLFAGWELGRWFVRRKHRQKFLA